MKNPFETGKTIRWGGEVIRPAYSEARSRLDRVREAGPDKLREMIAWPDVQKTVRQAAERRLRKLSDNDQAQFQGGSVADTL